MSKIRAKISLRGALKEIRPVNILMLFIAGIINSFGVTMFLFPVKLYDCSGKWGDSRNYDLCINSSNLGVDGVVDIIESLVKRELSSREALL